MSFRSILSGYPKVLNGWSIYFQYHNSQTSKQNNNEFLGFAYVHVLYIPLKLQNEYTGHVSISIFSYLIQYVLSRKNSLNCLSTFASPVGQLWTTVEGTASLT